MIAIFSAGLTAIGLALIFDRFPQRSDEAKIRLRSIKRTHLRAATSLLLSFIGSFGSIFILTGSISIALSVALLASAVPMLLMRNVAVKRSKEVDGAWPEALDSLVSGLHAGRTISESLIELATRGPEVLREDFGQIALGLREGRVLEDVLVDAARRMNSPIADQVFTTLIFAKEFGGNSTQTSLRMLASFVREDRQVIEEIETKFGWIRNSAVLAATAPWLLLIILSLQPNTVRAFTTPGGTAILSFAVISTAIAYLWMERVSALPKAPRPFIGSLHSSSSHSLSRQLLGNRERI